MDTRMYVMTHKRMEEIQDDIYIPLHVGREGKEDLGYEGDNSKDHISHKNANYCELTGMYWIWKNVCCDIVGICHYRRFFLEKERLIQRDEIESMLEMYDIIVPRSGGMPEGTVYEQYSIKHYAKDLDICRDIIEEKYPDYVAAFDFVMQRRFFSIGNMWITRKEIYDQYCEWLFDILFEVEKRIDMSGYDSYQARVMGFLSERLFRVWLMMQTFKIKEIKIKMIESSEFANADKKVELLYQYVHLQLTDLIQIHKADHFNQTLASEVICTDNFEGRIPVWVCWWQGEENAPELVRCCMKSLQQNLPMDKVCLRMITLENCMNYVSFTETIIQKFNDGIISFTHLSDILRAELLYRYGGMWIDATYFVTGRIPKELFDRKLIYTLRFKEAIWKTDVTKGDWSGNMWIAPPKHKLFQFLMESLWLYWEKEEKLRDYYLIDYVIAIAVEEFQEIANELRQCPYSPANVYELQKWMNKKCNEQRIKKIRTASLFYKLNRRGEYRKQTIAGEETVYGFLVGSV